MKRVFLLIILLSSLLIQGRAQFLEIRFTRESQSDEIARQGFDILEMDEKRAIIYPSPGDEKWLTDHGLAYSRVSPLKEGMPNQTEDKYLTFAEFETDLQSWAMAFPDISSLFSLGTSWEGRNIWMLKISDNAAIEEDEPEALLISLQHAREWLSGMTLYGVTRHFLTEYGTDPEVTELVNTMEIYIILVANPDGYVYTHETERFWRKNRRDNGDGSFGVDLNRNWGWSWDTAPSGPSSGTYRGPAPYSEPETQALRSWILAPERRLKGCLNYHTYGTRVMHNWAWTFTLPPNVDVMGPLARNVAFSIESVNGQRMRNGSWSITLDYAGGGATNDYLHAELGIPCLTLELRPGDGASGGFAPGTSSIDPSISENIAGAITFLKWIRDHAIDASPPVISDISITAISHDRATLNWTTDDPATRAVDYGTTPGYGSTVSPDKLRGLSQSVTLTGLNPGTLYHARARSENLAGAATVSGDITFTTTESARDITPPKYAAIEIIRQTGSGMMELRWVDLEGSRVLGYRLYESADATSWTCILDETSLPFGKSSEIISSPPEGSTRYYYMTTVDDSLYGNESIPSDVYAFMCTSGDNRVLIVDGYDRWNGKRIAQGGNHDFAACHGSAVGYYGIGFDTCANQKVGGEISLSDYDIVIWVLGDESTYNETFYSAEQGEVKKYLEGGGKLFVSGSEIGWDLDGKGSAEDKSFYNDYLHAEFVKDDMDDYDVFGTGPPGIFGSRLIRFDEGSRGIYRVKMPDVIKPLGEAAGSLASPSGEICAVQYTGKFGSGTETGQMVYLAFPFETIFPSSNRVKVMGDVLEYFGATLKFPTSTWVSY